MTTQNITNVIASQEIALFKLAVVLATVITFVTSAF